MTSMIWCDCNLNRPHRYEPGESCAPGGPVPICSVNCREFVAGGPHCVDLCLITNKTPRWQQ